MSKSINKTLQALFIKHATVDGNNHIDVGDKLIKAAMPEGITVESRKLHHEFDQAIIDGAHEYMGTVSTDHFNANPTVNTMTMNVGLGQGFEQSIVSTRSGEQLVVESAVTITTTRGAEIAADINNILLTIAEEAA